MKKLSLLLLLIFLLASCAPGTPSKIDEADEEPSAPVVIDEKTGLPINPETIPEGEFIVEGVINAVTVIPQDKPLFKIVTDSGIFIKSTHNPCHKY